MQDTVQPYVIVVGVDYSPASDLALARAFELAAESPQAEVHVVHVALLNAGQAVVDSPPPAGKSIGANSIARAMASAIPTARGTARVPRRSCRSRATANCRVRGSAGHFGANHHSGPRARSI